MHRHDAHLVAALLHVALDLDIAAAKLIDEALQRRRRLAVIDEREVEEFVDRLGRLGPESDQRALAHHLPFGTEQLGEELVWRQEIGARKPRAQALVSLGEAGIAAGSLLEHRP